MSTMTKANISRLTQVHSLFLSRGFLWLELENLYFYMDGDLRISIRPVSIPADVHRSCAVGLKCSVHAV